LHDWARKFQVLGHDLRLIPPIPVRPHGKRQKNDAAEAIGEAVQRPALRFVAVNSAGQQGVLMLHGASRTSGWPRHRLDQRSARGHFPEFGSVVAQGLLHGGGLVQRLMGRGGWGGACHLRCPQRLPPWLQRCSASVPGSASLTRRSLRHTETTRPALISRPSPAWRRWSPLRQRNRCPAVLLWAGVRRANLGLVPKPNATGGKPRLGAISKLGNRHLRILLVLGVHAALYRMTSGKMQSPLADWARVLLANKPFKLVTVALANTMAHRLGYHGERDKQRPGSQAPP